MPKHDKISMSVIRRLPRYYRFLGELSKSGITKISSRELSQRMGLTASQIRQDLNCFGGFGQQGYGYNIDQLHTEISSILGIGSGRPAIIVGAGNIGRAMAMNIDFDGMGFHLAAIFDNNPRLIGTKVQNITVQNVTNLEAYCTEHKPSIAVLTVPRSAAEKISERLIRLGVTGFWNFSHYDLSIRYPDVVVENVHLGDSLMTLSYMMKNQPDTSAE